MVVLAFLAVAGPLRAAEPVPFRFQVLSYNCGSGATIPLTPEGIRRVAEEIMDNRADIVGICEFDHGTSWYDGRDMFAELRVALADRGYPMHSFETPIFAYQGGWFVHGLLSRWAIAESDKRVVWRERNWIVDRITVEPVPGLEIDACMTHIWPVGGSEAYLEACFDYVNESPRPRLFMGDFNMTSLDVPEASGFRQTCMIANGAPCLTVGQGATISGPLPLEAQIDHIFVSEEFRVIRSYTHYTSLSDHWPIVAELEIDAPPGSAALGDNVRDPHPMPWDAAMHAYRRGEYELAAERFQAVHDADPTAQHAALCLYSAGCMHLLAGNASAAETAFHRTALEYPDSRWAVRASQRLSLLLEDQGRFEEAEREHERYIAGYFAIVHPNVRSNSLPAALRRLALYREKQGKPAAGMEILRDLASRWQGHRLGEAAEYRISLHYLEAKDYETWWTHYAKAHVDESKIPARDAVLRKIADAYAWRGEVDKAERMVRQYLSEVEGEEYHRWVLGRYWKNRYPEDYDIAVAVGEEREILLEGERHVVVSGETLDPPSGRLVLRVEPGSLVIRADVRDAIHHNPYAGEGIWIGDSIQVVIDPGCDGGGAYDANDSEFGAARTESGDVFHVWKRGSDAEPDRIEGEVRRDDVRGVTSYTLRIPFDAIGLPNGQDPEFAMNVLVNDNDGTGRAAFLEWTPGIAYEKTPEIFPVIRILR